MKPLNILVADDSPAVGLFVTEYLRSMGHSVTQVLSGEDAVAAFRQHSFDLVLMDVVMPGMGGLEAVRLIKEIPTPQWIPVVIITGLDAEEDILKGFLAGADDYIVKPIIPLKLDIRIRSMMRIAAVQRATAAVIDNVIEGIIQIDRVGSISRFNPAAELIFGYRTDEVLGKNVKMLMPSPYQEEHDNYLANHIATGEEKIIGIGRRVTGLRKNGETFPMHLGVTRAATPDGQFFIGLVRDLTTEDQLRRRVDYLASHDALTGLANRAECWQRLEDRFAIRSAQHGPADCTVFYCDLDGFKQVNDKHGHAAGDVVLKETSKRITEILFVRDILARIGGDEFLIVVDGVVDDAKAHALAQRIIDAVSQPIEANDGASYHVGITIGIAHSRQHPESVEALIEAADTAMYVAKRDGKGRAAIS